MPDETLAADAKATVAANAAAISDPNATVAADAAATARTLAAAGGRASPVAELVQPGTLIGRYMVLSQLGAGAMGVVLAAYDPDLDRKVALKLLKTRGEDQNSARARLQREAQALAKLAHPNVVGVHDVGVHEGQLFIGMEFVAGQTLGEWMKADAPRPWKRVLEVFMAAGRGLAAAHAAGLVHRDFKPDNVMLGDDGRVRVMDFGLARGEDEAGGVSPNLEPASASLNASVLTIDLTQPGALMGTPAYMSHEQFQGQPADARSDQFGFCAALYEALYGERAFAGTTIYELLEAVDDERIRPAPKGAKVPPWLRAVVVRGLAKQPEDRWPSMEALLDALTDDPAVRRRKWGAVAIVVALLGAGTWGVWSAARADANTCAGMEDHLVGVWDDARRAELKAAIEATGLSYAADTWERVQPWLDDYASSWVAARVEACEATHRGEQSGELLDLRMACLDDRLVDLRTTVDVLSHADAEVVDKAVQAASSLPTLDRCADVDALTAQVPPPDDPEVAKRVDELMTQLTKSKAVARAGEYTESLELAQAVVGEAEQLGYEPLEVRAWAQQGGMLIKTGDYEGAQAAMKRAYESAVGLRMAPEAAEASAQLVWVVGKELARYEDGRRWAEDARPLARAAGTDEAQALYLNALGAVAVMQGSYAEARELAEQLLAIRERTLGPDHPLVAAALNNVGSTARMQGQLAEAREYLERAQAIREKALGPRHPELASSLHNLGAVALREGSYAEARAYNQRALEIREQVLGPNHPSVAYSLNTLALVAHAQGDYEQARKYYERAVAIYEQALGPEHRAVATPLSNLADVARAQGKYDEARGEYERALAIWERTLPPEHPSIAEARTGLGRTLVEQGLPDEALPYLEQALAVCSSIDSEPTDLANTRFALARALWDASVEAGRDRARAIELAKLAQAAYAEAGATSASALQEVQAWQAEHHD